MSLPPLQSSIIPSELQEPIPGELSPLSPTLYKEMATTSSLRILLLPSFPNDLMKSISSGTPWVAASGWLSRLHIKGTNICFTQASFRSPFLQSTREVRAFSNCRALTEFRLCYANVNTISGYFFLCVCLFWLHRMVCGILVPQPRIQPVPPEVKVWNPNHWTAREFPEHHFWILKPTH